MFDRVILKNIGSLFGIQMASYVIPLITLPYLVRVLGVEGYGYLGFSLAIVQYAVLVINFGFDLSATSAISKVRDNKQLVSHIYWNVISIRVMSTIFCFFALVGAALVSQKIASIMPILLACYIGAIGSALFPQWLFQGKEQLGTISIVRVFFQFLTIPFLFLFVNDESHIWRAALINSTPILFIAVFSTFLIIKRKWIEWQAPTWMGIKEHYNQSVHIFLSSAAVSLYTTSVTVVLGFISGPVSVGYFSAADRLIKAVLGIYSTVSNSFFPRINAMVAESRVEAISMLKKFSRVVLLIAILSMVCVYFSSEFAVELLFGSEFLSSVLLLKIFSVLPVIICLSNIFGVQILIPFGYKREFSSVLILSGLLSLVLIFPLAFLFNEVGASISVVLTELLVTLLMYRKVSNLKIMSE